MKVFLGVFLGVLVLGWIGYRIVRKKLRQLSREALGGVSLSSALGAAGLAAAAVQEDAGPKSLNGADSLLLPRIREDFPDFDPELMKTYARQALQEKFKSKQALTIYNVVMAKYDRAGVQKSILLQASLSWQEGGRVEQKRYLLRYAYQVQGSSATVAANCPNCGSPIAYGQTVCEYCGSGLTGIMKAAWSFTEIREG